uniref:Secreted protein n=1 Tax=Arundo donax TaxID=35708 RepID=A0A0A9B8A2_ARUDO
MLLCSVLHLLHPLFHAFFFCFLPASPICSILSSLRVVPGVQVIVLHQIAELSHICGGRRRRTPNRSRARAENRSGEALASPVKMTQERPGQRSCTSRTRAHASRHQLEFTRPGG